MSSSLAGKADILSKLTGKKKALVIGIRYNRDKETLDSPDHYNFPESNIILLTDETDEALVSKANILKEMELLVKDAQAHDSLFFYYSGHDFRDPDQNGDEWDNLDEYIVPADRRKNGYICDDQIYEILVQPLPEKCRLTALLDTCQCGTMFDLPYEYNELAQRVFPYDPSKECETRLAYLIRAPEKKFATYDPKINEAKQAPPKDVICFSSCHDKETAESIELPEIGEIGLYTYAFIGYTNPAKSPTYSSIIKNTASMISKHGFDFHPQFSSNYLVDMDTPFKM